MPDHTHAVALTCPDEAALRKLWERISLAGVKHIAILECDGEHAGQLMAIGCTPGLRNDLKKYFSSLPLLK